MNLVVDDAVEVRLATKSEEEKRRNLGISFLAVFYLGYAVRLVANVAIEQAKSFSKAITFLSFKQCNDDLIQYYAKSMGEWGDSILIVSAFKGSFVFLDKDTKKYYTLKAA